MAVLFIFPSCMPKRFVQVVSAAGSVAHLRLVLLKYIKVRTTFTHLGTLKG